jgi:hypothetical protein
MNPTPSACDITPLLEAARAGDPDAAARLYDRVYDELRHVAAAKMAREASGHTLQPTALVPMPAWSLGCAITRGILRWTRMAVS